MILSEDIRNTNKWIRSRKGFSLIEILIVLAIIALLATVVVTNFTGIFGGAQESTATTFVTQSLKTPLLKYRIDMGKYPNTAEGLNALLNAPASANRKWKGPYIEQLPQDPWGNPYHYRFPGSRSVGTYDLWSWGPDGTESADDIGNWQEE